VRNRALAVIGTALLLALAGCTTPEPATPTPTAAFSSEEEAFAAAEETYRAYVDALNQVDLSDPETFEAVYAWTTGDFNADERKTLSTMHANDWTLSGSSVVSRVDYLDMNDQFAKVALGSCVDVSSIRLLDADGASQVSPDRPDVQTTRVDLVASKSSPTGYLIVEVAGHELDPPCQS
jgi:hypothetical protein